MPGTPFEMSYQVIARKYRPQRFADVVGQEHVTQTLANAIRSGRIAHAYLFCGPRGTGKTTLARIFAKALNCTNGPTVEFDNADPRVQEITEGRSLDVFEIDGASNNGVEQVRELRETARFAPAASRFKIYIIDEVHMLSTAAFNALLKTLEEPPAHVKFFFATTDPEKVLPTILSRCQRFDLRRIPAALIVKHLAWIATQENVSIDEAALHSIARGADGGMRDAESTLDQLISFCGGKIVEEDVLSMFGLAARGQLLNLADAVIGGHAEQALRGLDELARAGRDLGRTLSDLLRHFRNLLLYQVSRGDLGMLEVSEAEVQSLQAQALRIETEAVTHILEVLSAAEGRLRDTASKRILIEVTLLKAIQAREALSLETVLRQLRELRGGSSAPPPPAKDSSPAPATPSRRPATPVSAPLPKPPGGTAAETSTSAAPPPTAPVAGALDLWPSVLSKLGLLQRASYSDAQPLSFLRGLLTVGFPAGSDHFSLCNTRENAALLVAKYKELGAGEVSIRFVQLEMAAASVPATVPAPAPEASLRPPPPVAASPAGPSVAPAAAASKVTAPKAAAPATLDKTRFLEDPLIKQALEIFKAQLIEVRGPEPGT